MQTKLSQLEASSIRFAKIVDNSRKPAQNIAFVTYTMTQRGFMHSLPSS